MDRLFKAKMLRNNRGKKGKEEDDFIVQVKQNTVKEKVHPVFQAFMEQLLKAYPFWVKEDRKLTCCLCNHSVKFNKITAFKIGISTHLESKYHKIKIRSLVPEKDNVDKNHNKVEKEDDDVKPNLEMVRNVALNDETKCEGNSGLGHDFETAYCSLEKGLVTRASKKFIVKANDDKNYLCKVCKELILYALNVNEFRHNLWNHLNDEKHRKLCDILKKEKASLERAVCKFSKNIPENLKDDINYFKTGPVFRFVECSLCNVAVSIHPHRLENHIRGISHQNNKNKNPKACSDCLKNNRTRNWFIKLMSKLKRKFVEDKLQEDLKEIRIGKMPGYVVCTLCSHAVLPTFHYLNEHFTSNDHLKNKVQNVVEWESWNEMEIFI